MVKNSNLNFKVVNRASVYLTPTCVVWPYTNNHIYSILKIKSIRTVNFKPENDKIGGYRKNVLFSNLDFQNLNLLKNMSVLPLINDISIVQWTKTFCYGFKITTEEFSEMLFYFSRQLKTRFLKFNSGDYFQKNMLI